MQVKNDIETLKIGKNENEIRNMKKYAFKKLIKKKLNENATNFLFYNKNEEQRSKIKNLSTFKLQNYLLTNKLSKKEKKLLFSLRTRSIDVKRNYKNKFKFNMQCRLCDDDKEIESEEHYLACKKFLENIDNKNELLTVKYEHIFSADIEKQISITKIFDKIFKIRTKLMNNL